MPMTPAEKQARYRERHLQEGQRERLQLIVSTGTKRALERLARHQGTSQTALFEKLILEAQTAATAGMGGEEYRVYVGE